MSPLSKTLLKMILTVLAIYLIVAAVPIVQQFYQGLVLTPVPLPAPVLLSLPAGPAGQDSAAQTATVQGVAPTPGEPALAPVLPTAPLPASPNQSVLSSRPIRLPGRIENNPNAYLLTAIYRVEEPAYQLQTGTPIFMQNFAHTYAGCSWMSVAGQVFDAQGNPLKNLVVTIKGTLNGKTVELMSLTGMAQEYGPGGYEIQLSSSPVASTAKLSIQVFDLNGNALTEPVLFNTSAGCSENVILINFAP
jgi:hypothetical protein